MFCDMFNQFGFIHEEPLVWKQSQSNFVFKNPVTHLVSRLTGPVAQDVNCLGNGICSSTLQQVIRAMDLGRVNKT